MIYCLLSISRTITIINGYSAPINLLIHSNSTNSFLKESNSSINICIGKDWFRFPSHFFLPNRFVFIENNFSINFFLFKLKTKTRNLKRKSIEFFFSFSIIQ